LLIADCRLLIEKKLDSCWSLHLIYSGAGMTRERERELRLLVGATLCGRPKTAIGKWQLIIKISSTQRLTITHKYQEAGIPLIFS